MNEDCWNFDFHSGLATGAILSINSASHMAYLSEHISRLLGTCQETCTNNCTCNCSVLEEKSCKPPGNWGKCGPPGISGKKGQHGDRGSKGCSGYKE